MWNMQHGKAHHLVVREFRYLQNSASSGAKSLFSNQKWLYFQSCLLSFKDIKHWSPPKDAAWKAAYFTYPALNFLINIGGLNWGNHFAKPGTELAGCGFSLNQCSRNCLIMELLLPPIEVEPAVIHRFNFDVLLHYLTLWDEVEQSQKMYHFLKHDHFGLSIW